MRKKLNVLLLFDSPFFAPRDYDFDKEFQTDLWTTERNVYGALLKNRYKVKRLGIHDNISILIDEIKENRPDIVFSLTEVFNEKTRFDKNVVWLLDMLEVPYTGASPAILQICNNKALTKKILSYHRIKVPDFYTFFRKHKIWLPKKLKTPLIVKPLSEEASRGISQASVVDNEEKLIERVKFIHENMNLDVIVEEYIDGREFYIGVMGYKQIKVFPPIELKFGNELEDEARIATYKAKWDNKYRKKWGIKNTLVGKLPEGIGEKITDICKRAYKSLDIRSYTRFDIRLASDGHIHILEVNANPCLGKDEDFALCAEKAGLPFNTLIKKIISLGLARQH